MTKILVIDDEPDLCFFVKANLELAGGYQVFTATDGAEGIRIAEQHHPDLILLDVMMPKMTGFDVLTKLKANKRTITIPVIMLTARNDPESKGEAISLYVEGYLVKPVTVEALRGAIEKTLARCRKGNA